jgi:hypothetical protein
MLRAMRTLLALTSLIALAAPALAQDVPADPAPTPAPEPTAPQEPPPAADPTAPAEPLPPPAADPAPEPAPAPAPMPQYDGQVDADGRAHYTGEPPEEDYGYEDASYPPPEPDDEDSGGDDFEIPPFSIRLDPFNWLIEGRLGLELEVGIPGVDWLTVELVPVFVANEEPPTFNFSGREDPLSQESNGIGPMAGASIGAGFWLTGRPLEGYVLRVALTNVGITYKASDASGVFDKVSHVERRFVVMLGSHTRFGFFTIAGGIGLGYELNQEERCYTDGINADSVATRNGCPDGELQIAADDPAAFNGAPPSVVDLNGFLHPVYLEGRFSIGVSFD